MPDAGPSRGVARCRPALGTFVEIGLPDAAPKEDAHAAFAAAFAAIARVEAAMSFHDPASDLSRLNAQAHRRPVAVDPWLVDLLAQAHALFAATDGAFDCTVGADLVRAGLLPRHGPDDGPAAADPAATFDDVVLDDGRRVRYRRPLALDLGGVAKGFAVDRAIDALRAHSVATAVVNAGGDLRVLGTRAVPIHVRVGVDDDAVVPLGLLADGAVATSRGRAAHGAGRRASGALVDAATRAFVVDDGRTYSVIAPDCATADALTKVLATTGTLAAACRSRFGAVPLVRAPR